jgi:hypothetical protein
MAQRQDALITAFHGEEDQGSTTGCPASSVTTRKKKFGELGVTNIRTFTDPTNPARVAVSGDVPDLPAFMAWLQSHDGAASAASDGVLLDTLVFLVES